MVLMEGQIHESRGLEAQKRLESCKEMGWVTLGHTFSCGHVLIYQAKPGICCWLYYNWT